MSFGTLPSELLFLIAGYLSHSDLFSWTQAARRYHSVLTDRLYPQAISDDKEGYGYPVSLFKVAASGNRRALECFLNHVNDVNGIRLPPKGARTPSIDEENADHVRITSWDTLLHFLCRGDRRDYDVEFGNGNPEDLIKLVLDKGADVSIRSFDWFSPLDCAAEAGNTAVIQILLGAGADINLDGGTSVLDHAITLGSPAVRELLLESGADVLNVRTPFWNMVDHRCWGIIAALVEKMTVEGKQWQSDIGRLSKRSLPRYLRFAPDISPLTLHKAARLSQIEVVKILLNNGFDPYVKDALGNSALHLVHDPSVARLLLDVEPGLVMARNKSGCAPLECVYDSICVNREAVTILLAEAGAGFDDIDGAARAVKYATRYGHERAVSTLFEIYKERLTSAVDGADLCLMAVMRHYERSCQCPVKKKQRCIRAMLKKFLQFGVKLSGNDQTVVSTAIRSGYYKLLPALQDAGIDVLNQTGNGPTVLHAAVSQLEHSRKQKRQIEAMKLAIKMGVDVSARDSEGHTALWRALYRSMLDLGDDLKPLRKALIVIAISLPDVARRIYQAFRRVWCIRPIHLLLEAGASTLAEDSGYALNYKPPPARRVFSCGFRRNAVSR